jgi:ribosomal 50S subunit-recycling heat shock protein
MNPKEINMPVLDWLYKLGVVLTRAQAARMAAMGAIKINGEVVTNLIYRVKEGDRIQIGKTRFYTVEES